MASVGGIHIDYPEIAFDRLEKEVRKFLKGAALDVVGMEAMKFIRMNFDKQGFVGGRGLQKWAKRKKPASVYYKRGKRRGQLTKTGKAYMRKKSMPLFSSSGGGSLMRNSFDYTKSGYSVKIYSHLPYAFYHNYGTDKLPRRMFIGPSGYLNKRIAGKINKEVYKRFGYAYRDFKVSDIPPMHDVEGIEDVHIRGDIMSNFDLEVVARYATRDNLRRLIMSGGM